MKYKFVGVPPGALMNLQCFRCHTQIVRGTPYYYREDKSVFCVGCARSIKNQGVLPERFKELEDLFRGFGGL